MCRLGYKLQTLDVPVATRISRKFLSFVAPTTQTSVRVSPTRPNPTLYNVVIMSSSSPEQSLTPPTASGRISHSASACSVEVAGVMESSPLSPPTHALSSHHRASLSSTSSPSSPQLPSRGSTGKLQRGKCI